MQVKIATTGHSADDPRVTMREGLAIAQEYGHTLLMATTIGSEKVPAALGFVDLGSNGGWAGRLGRLARIAKDVLLSKPSVYHFHDPELFVLTALARCRRHLVVIDLHEDYPRQFLAKPYLHASLRRPASTVISLYLKGTCAIASGVVVADDFVAENLGLPDACVVRNFASIEDFSAPAPQIDGLVVSMGSNSLTRCFPEMVKAADLLTSEGATVVIGGHVADSLMHDLQVPGNVMLPGWQDRSQVAELYARAHVGWALLKDVPQYRLAVPTKLYEYMLAGLPVVTSDFGAMREVVEAAGCGLVASPNDPSAVADATRELLKDPERAQALGRAGREYALQNFEWKGEARRLLEMYSRVMKR